MVNLAEIDTNAKETVYVDEEGNLYAHSPTSDGLFHLSPRDYSGKLSEKKGKMKKLGDFHLCY